MTLHGIKGQRMCQAVHQAMQTALVSRHSDLHCSQSLAAAGRALWHAMQASKGPGALFPGTEHKRHSSHHCSQYRRSSACFPNQLAAFLRFS